MFRARAVIAYTGSSGAPGLMTWYGRQDTVENQAGADLAAQRLNDAIALAHNLIPHTCTFTGVATVDQLDHTTGALTGQFAVAPWSVTGDVSQDGYLPPANQIVLSFSTGDFVNGRRVRGHSFLGPIWSPNADIDGTLTATALTRAQAVAAKWNDSGATAVHAVVWHRPVGGSGGSIHDITGTSVKDKFGVLRSRRD